LPSTYVGEKPILINGVPVYIGATGDYYAPALEVEVKVNGPLAKRLLGSLTRSPRAVVLDSGSAPAVPSSWQTVTFAGVRFSVPGDWPIDQTSFVRVGLGNPCALEPGLAFTNKGSTLLTGGVTLTSDQHLLPPPACASMRYITAQVPMDGVQADSGRSVHFRVTLSFAKHCLRLRGLTACPATSPAFSILVLWVKVPARSVGVFVSLGLAGNGMVARTILYSLKEA
jgi:hypothetical protein